MTENYSSGTQGGYAFTKPFNLSQAGNGDQMSYIGKDGYLYTAGWSWGGTSSNSNATFYKQTNAGTNIVDHEISYNSGIIVNSTGQVKVAAASGASTTQAWSTVSVGGSATGSSNKAVAVSISGSYQMVLMENGRLYVSSQGATSMTSTVSFNYSSTGGIVDISMGNAYQYVLFGNGDLYGSNKGVTSMSRIATGVKMFDVNTWNSNYIYIYDGNMIKTASAAGSGTHTWSNLLSSNRTDIVQIRGTAQSGGGWGFLTSDKTLYTMENSNATTQWTGSNHTRSETGVSYFDTSAYATWGYLKNGQIYLWNTGSSFITSNTSPGSLSGASDLPTPDLGGIPSISSSPPAKVNVNVQNKTDLNQISSDI